MDVPEIPTERITSAAATELLNGGGGCIVMEAPLRTLIKQSQDTVAELMEAREALKMANKLLEDATREKETWKELAKQATWSAEYYRDLIVKCGEHLGVAAKTADDGTIQSDVLCEKVPELLEHLTGLLETLRKEYETWTKYTRIK